MGSYVPSTLNERQEMLDFIGCKTLDDLFADVPKSIVLNNLDIPKGLAELDVRRSIEKMASKNKVYTTIFRGAGAYNHYIPSVVKQITSKEEFLTAYTPYQAEISQGILQSIFEYQTMMCELTGMDVSNASVYDGATAAAEAVTMCHERNKTKAFVSATSHPDTIAVMQTYCHCSNTELVIIPEKNGLTDLQALEKMLDKSAACVYVQHPNFYGNLEDADKISQITHAASAKFIMGCNPIALAILKTPAEYGADIATGEGQPLGMPLSFGGPYLGFMACTKAMMRKLPGRVVGETADTQGARAFVLTLQAREQHIRREKASSSICSNQAHCALTASVYLSTMGPIGLKNVAEQCYSKAHYAASLLNKIKGFELKFNGDFFHEFVTNCPINKDELVSILDAKNMLGGYPVEDGILWCFTEMNTKQEIDSLASILNNLKGAAK